MLRFTARPVTAAVTAPFVLIATPALAQPIVVADSGDSAWVLVCAVLLLVAALPGVTLLFGGARARIAQVGALAIGALLFAGIGYSLAFGEGSPILGGFGNALLNHLADLRVDTTVPESAYVLFQIAAAALALSLLVVPLARRARLGWLLPFSAAWLLVVYVPVARWLWGGGWLAALGALDFAGGIVVAGTAGMGGLVVALLLRARAPVEDDTTSTAKSTGAALVLIGGLGLVGGAALGAGDDAAAAMLDVVLAASGGVVATLAAAGVARRMPGGDSLSSGALAGFAAMTAGAGFVGPAGAVVIGVAGALVALAAGRFVRAAKIADSASSFATFGSAGLVGALLFPLCVAEALGGPGFDQGAGFVTQFIAQGVAVLAVALWTTIATAIAALAVSAVVPMRAASAEAEVSRPS